MSKLFFYPHITLMQKSTAIDNINSDVKRLADDLSEIMYANGGIGLAANQVGFLKRIIVVRAEDISANFVANSDVPNVLINPVVVEQSQELLDSQEGCLSFPGLEFIVKRPKSLLVKAITLDEKEIEIEASDLFAACLAHEIEHLDGITLIDKISKTQKKIYLDKLKRNKKLLANNAAKI